MSYLKLAYPKVLDGLNKSLIQFPPPKVDPTGIGGLHYYTWRNVIARDAMKEKEEVDLTPENNPEQIPAEVTRRYQDHNFIQCVQPLQLFTPRSLTEDVNVDKDRKELSLINIVKAAYGDGKTKLKVKAVGTGHSFSDIMTTPDFLVVTDELKRFLEPQNLPADEVEKLKEKGVFIQHYSSLKSEVIENYSLFSEYEGDDNHKPGLVEFEAGIKLDTLAEKLWDRGWSFSNLGTYQGQSFIGAVSTSTHGSGESLGPLPDMIKSLVIVADNGMVYRIEPTKGITESKDAENSYPSHFPADFMVLPPELDSNEEEDPKEKFRKVVSINGKDGVDYLIQDDDFFNSVLVNVGTFGIIYSVIIEVVPRFYLIETTEITTWKDLRDRLLDAKKREDIFEKKEFISTLKHKVGTEPDPEFNKDGYLKVENIRQTSFLFNANYYNRTDKKEIFFRITRQYEVSWDMVTKNGWNDDKDKGRVLGKKLKAGLQPLFDIIGERLAYKEPEQTKLYETKLQLICGNIIFTEANQPSFLKCIDQCFSGLIKESLDSDASKYISDQLLNDKVLTFLADTKHEVEEKINDVMGGKPLLPKSTDFYLNRNYRVYVKTSDLNGYGIETGFRVEKRVGEAEPQYILAIDKAIEIAEQHWLQGRYIQTATTAVRFVKASRAYLSPQYGELTCMIEMLNVADTHGGKELFYRYQRAFIEMGGRPHWGLDLSVTTGNNHFLENTYPKFLIWKKVYDLMNNYGTFDNRFTDRMGLSIQPYPKR